MSAAYEKVDGGYLVNIWPVFPYTKYNNFLTWLANNKIHIGNIEVKGGMEEPIAHIMRLRYSLMVHSKDDAVLIVLTFLIAPWGELGYTDIGGPYEPH